MKIRFQLLATICILGCADASTSERKRDTVALAVATDSIVDLTRPEIILELSTGSVLIPDSGLPGLLKIDMVTGRQDTIGRAGDGPGEFRTPSFVQELAGGRVAVLDGLARRITIWSPSLAFEQNLQPPAALSPFLLRFDSLGNAYSTQTPNGPFQPHDSLAVLRVRVGTQTVDTIAFVQRLQTTMLQIGATMMGVPAEYASRDLWGVLPDGTVWIGRGERRELEIIRRDARRTTYALPFAATPTVDADRKRFRGLPAPAEVAAAVRPMAPVKGPFQEIRADAAGHFFLWLNQPAGYVEELYAEFNSEGQWIRTIRLPAATKIIAVGIASVYSAQEATDGSWILRRHPRPR